MSFRFDIENSLHEARIQQLTGSIEECLRTYLKVMDKLDSLKSSVTGVDAEWVAVTFNHAMEEFNLIRSSNPNIILSVGEMEMEDKQDPKSIDARVYSEGIQEEMEVQEHVFPVIPQDSQIATEVNEGRTSDGESFSDKVETFAKSVTKKIEELDQRYHFSDDISSSIKLGVSNVKQFFTEKPLQDRVKDSYEETREWMMENCTKEKIVDGISKAPYIVIDGAKQLTIFVSSSLIKLLNLIRGESVEAPEESNQPSAEAPAIVSAQLSPSDVSADEQPSMSEQASTAPVEPAGPVEPVEPAVPGMPGMIGAPGTPALPVAAEAPEAPEKHVEAVAPAEQGAPMESGNAEEDANVKEPVEPVEQVEHVEPVNAEVAEQK